MEEKRIPNDDIINKMIFIPQRTSKAECSNLDITTFYTDANDQLNTNHKPTEEEIELQSSINFLKKRIELLKGEIKNFDNLSKKFIDQTNKNYDVFTKFSCKGYDKKEKSRILNSKSYSQMLKPKENESVRMKLQDYEIEELLGIIEFQNSRLIKLEDKITPETTSLLQKNNLPLKPTFNMLIKNKAKIEKGISKFEKVFEKIEKKINKIDEKESELKVNHKKWNDLMIKNDEFTKKLRNLDDINHDNKKEKKLISNRTKLSRSIKTLEPLKDLNINKH